MNSGTMISEQQFRAAIAPEQVRAMRIQQVALAIGLVLFAGAIAFLASQSPQPTTPTAAATHLIARGSWIHSAVFVAGWFVSDVLFSAKLRRARQTAMQPGLGIARSGSVTPASSAQPYWIAIREAYTLRLALREAPALFGSTICFLAMQNGVLAAHPVAALNFGSSAAAVAYFIATLPNEERLVAAYRKHLAQSPTR